MIGDDLAHKSEFSALIDAIRPYVVASSDFSNSSRASDATRCGAFKELKRLAAFDGDPKKGSRSRSTIVRRRHSIQLAFADMVLDVTRERKLDTEQVHDRPVLYYVLKMRRLVELWRWAQQPVSEILPLCERRPRRSKCRTLRLMPKTTPWQKSIISAVKRPNNRLCIAILGLTGSRPCELERGVRIEREPSGLIKITVRTAKDPDGNSRTISIAKDAPLAEYLDVTPGTYYFSADALRAAARRSARLTVPKVRFSIYILRHAFSSVVKRDLGCNAAAKALGHASPKNTTRYGSRKLASRSGVIVVPAEIRTTKGVVPRSIWMPSTTPALSPDRA